MGATEALAEKLAAHLKGRLKPGTYAMIQGDFDEGDPDMAIDDCLQFSLVDDVHIEENLLAEVRELIDEGGIDEALHERCQNWLSMHWRNLKHVA